MIELKEDPTPQDVLAVLERVRSWALFDIKEEILSQIGANEYLLALSCMDQACIHMRLSTLRKEN